MLAFFSMECCFSDYISDFLSTCRSMASSSSSLLSDKKKQSQKKKTGRKRLYLEEILLDKLDLSHSSAQFRGCVSWDI